MKGMPAERKRRGPLAVLLDWIDAKVTPRADARAVEMGLEITRIPGTRTQLYRDPTRSPRKLCDVCAGSGVEGARPCDHCDGSGVARRPAPGRGDAR